MYPINPDGSNRSSLQWLRRVPWLLIPVMLLMMTVAHAQQLTATLTGIATDQTDARIPGANVEVKNDATGDVRTTKADNQGFFSLTALIPGTYTLTINAKGFAGWQETGILLNQGDSRTVPNIHLKIGSEATAVTVISGEDAEVPVDNAEISATLNNELVDSAVLTGRNASELIKMMPGVVFNNNGGAGSAYNSQVTGTNNGPAGSFSSNGTQPYGSTVVMLDGANLLDPGNAGTQVANVNQDMTDSVKYLSASYGAEYAKGPAVLQAFSKSGGQKYHGEVYLYARNTAVGYANDWNSKYLATSQGKKPILHDQSFYYMGGNVGGPISLLGFNKNKDKLFFWGGYEYMRQHPYNNPINMNVPTDAQRSGDFSNTGVPSGVLGVYNGAYQKPCQTISTTQGAGCSSANSPWGGYGSGSVPNVKQYFDPAGVKITNLNPAANQTPNAANGWNNYGYAPSLPQNRWEATGKVTYAFNDNNKLWGSYAYQSETDEHPLSIWWAPTWTIPYPGQPVGKVTANVYLANYTHVFSPTSTNELVFAYSKFVNKNSLGNADAVSRAKLGFPATSVFGASKTDQIPAFQGGWNSGTTWIYQFDFQSGIYGKNTFGKTSQAPSISDTFTKIIKTHSVKAGFYWDGEENLQSNGSDTPGTFYVGGGTSSTGNETLDRLMGRNDHYTETNVDAIPNILWHQWSLWAQDSWKATPKWTINVGLRADHMGQWYNKKGGTQVWDPASYNNSSSAPANTGLLWHALNSKIPESGWKSDLFLWSPRIGAAYDVFGTGKTVVRAGFGTYRYQVSGNDASAAMSGPMGSFQFSSNSTGVNGFYGYDVQDGKVYNGDPNQNPNAVKIQIPVPTGVNQNGTDGLKADKQGDSKIPYANTWSFGVAQALPGHTVAEFSYVGSMSRNQLLNGANGHIEDANVLNNGVFFGKDPIDGNYHNPAPYSPTESLSSSMNSRHYRAYQNYGSIYLQTHGGYANYNSLQVSAQKQSGNLFIFTNFTFGKVLGTRDGSTSNGNGNGSIVNPFNLDANYGPLAYDHTKAFKFSASYKLPSFFKGHALLGEAVNGWQVTTYTEYQDGNPYQASTPAMNASWSNPNVTDGGGTHPFQVYTVPLQGAAVEGSNQTTTINTSTWFGSSQYPQMQPVLVCDPRKGLHKGQYFNPNCFVSPQAPTANSPGQFGQTIWPYIRSPHYFNSDLAVFKAFRITDAQRVEARISATNWLNHPNAQFGLNGNADNQLTFVGASTSSGLVYNSNSSTTGIPNAKIGYRWLQFAIKYYF